METSLHSQLPTYTVTVFHIDEPAGSYDMLQVGCPRCRGEFWVRRTWGVIYNVPGASDKPPARPFGRSCPYCVAASAIPEQFRIYADTERPKPTTPKPRRVVRRRRSR